MRSIAMLVLVGCGRLQFAPLPADDAALAGDEGTGDAADVDPRLVAWFQARPGAPLRDVAANVDATCTTCPTAISEQRDALAFAGTACVTVPYRAA